MSSFGGLTKEGSASVRDLIEKWNDNYARGRANAYPYDWIVGAILGRFGNAERSKIRVLDLGCGGGNHAWFLAREGFDFRAVDGAANAVKLTRDRVGPEHADHVIQSDLRCLPFESGFFDAVIDRQSLGHNQSADIKRIVGILSEILVPDGVYIGEIFSTCDSDLQYAGGRDGSDFYGFEEGKFRHSPIVHAFNVEEVQSLFADFELEQLQRCTIAEELHKGKRSEVFRLVARRIG